MSQYQDTVREELVDILDKLQEIYRKTHPGSILLFANGDASFTTQDVSRTTQSLFPEEGGSKSLDYSVYAHNIPSGNQQVGQLHTEGRMGRVDVGYVDRASPEKKLRFKMKVGFGGRVIDYELEGSDGMYRSQFQKSMVISALEQTFSR